MSKFNREDRYIVIKRSDLDKIPNQKVVHKFLGSLGEVCAHSCRIPQRQYLVIKNDWPEYEQKPDFVVFSFRLEPRP